MANQIDVERLRSREVETEAIKAMDAAEMVEEEDKRRAEKRKVLQNMTTRTSDKRKYHHKYNQKGNKKFADERYLKRGRDIFFKDPAKVINLFQRLKSSQGSVKRSEKWTPEKMVRSFWETKMSSEVRKPLTEQEKQEEFEIIKDLMGRKKTIPMVTLNLLRDVLRGERVVYERDVYNRQVTRDPNQYVKSDDITYHISLYRKKKPKPLPVMRCRKTCEETTLKYFPQFKKMEKVLHRHLADWDNRAPVTESSTTSIPSSVISASSQELIQRDENFVPFNEAPLKVYPVAADITRDDMKLNYVQGFYHDQRNFHEKVRFLRYYNFTVPMQIVLSEKDYGCAFLVDNILPIDFLIDIGFNCEEAAASLLDLKLKARIVAAVREAQIWSRFVTKQQGGLILVMCWFMSREDESKRFLLPFVEAIVNCRITSCTQIEAHMRLLCHIDQRARRKISLLPKSINIPKILQRGPIKIKEILLSFVMDLYSLANEVSQSVRGCNVGSNEAKLIEHIALNFRMPILRFMDILGTYIGYKLMTTKEQVNAALDYLSEQKSTDIDVLDFEKACDIDGRELNRCISRAVVDEVMKEIFYKSVKRTVSSESEIVSGPDVSWRRSTVERDWADLWQGARYRGTMVPDILKLKKDYLELHLSDIWPRGTQTQNRVELSPGRETEFLRCMPNQYVDAEQKSDDFRQDKSECLTRIGARDVLTGLHNYSDPLCKDIRPLELDVPLECDSTKLGSDLQKRLRDSRDSRSFEGKHDTQTAVECVLAKLRAMQRGDLRESSTRANIGRANILSRHTKQSDEVEGINLSEAAKIRSKPNFVRQSDHRDPISKSQPRYYLPEKQLGHFVPNIHIGDKNVVARLIVGAKKGRKHLMERINGSHIDRPHEDFDIGVGKELSVVPRKEWIQQQSHVRLNTILEEAGNDNEKNRSENDGIEGSDNFQGAAGDGEDMSYVAFKGRNDRKYGKHIGAPQNIHVSAQRDRHIKQSSIAKARSKDIEQRIGGKRTKDGIGQRDENEEQGKSGIARNVINIRQRHTVQQESAVDPIVYDALYPQRDYTAEKPKTEFVKTEFDGKQNVIPHTDRSCVNDKQCIPLMYHERFGPFTECGRGYSQSTRRFQEVAEVMRLTERNDKMRDVNEVLRTYYAKLKEGSNARARYTSREPLKLNKPQDKSTQRDDTNSKSLDHGIQSQTKLFHKRDSSELLRYIYTELKKSEINEQNNQNDLTMNKIKPQEKNIGTHDHRGEQQGVVTGSLDYYRVEHCQSSQLFENEEISHGTRRVPRIPSGEIKVIHYSSNTISTNQSSSSTDSDGRISRKGDSTKLQNMYIESPVKQGEGNSMYFASRKREQERGRRFLQWHKTTQLNKRDTDEKTKLFDIKTRKTKSESKTNIRTEQLDKTNGQQGIRSNSSSSNSREQTNKDVTDFAQSKIKLHINLHKIWRNRKADSQKKHQDSTSSCCSSKVSMAIRNRALRSQDIQIPPSEVRAGELRVNSNFKYSALESQCTQVKQKQLSKKDLFACERASGHKIKDSEKEQKEIESYTSSSTTQWDMFNGPRDVRIEGGNKYSRHLCHSKDVGQIQRDSFPEHKKCLEVETHHESDTSSSTSSSSSRVTIKQRDVGSKSHLHILPHDKQAGRDVGSKSSDWIHENKNRGARLSEKCRLLYERHTHRKILKVETQKHETNTKTSPSITQCNIFNGSRDDWSENITESSTSLRQKSKVRGTTFQTQDLNQMYNDIYAKSKSCVKEPTKTQYDSDTSSNSSSSSTNTMTRLDIPTQPRVKRCDGRGQNTLSLRCDSGANEQVFYMGQDQVLPSSYSRNEREVYYDEAQKIKSESNAHCSLVQRDSRQLDDRAGRRGAYPRSRGSAPPSKLIQSRRLDQSTPAKISKPMNREVEEMNIQTESKTYSNSRPRDNRDERHDVLPTTTDSNLVQQSTFSLWRYVCRVLGISGTQPKNSNAQGHVSPTQTYK